MAFVRFVSHPQVRVSAEIPVGRWGLSDLGRERAEALCNQAWLAEVTRIVSSEETKSLETAAIISAATGVSIEVRPATHENDRSSTGFVPPDRFEQLADAFFAKPNESVEGWETSSDAQRRIVAATADLFDIPAAAHDTDKKDSSDDQGDVVISGHGGVGTLLLCHLLDVPIGREHDQSSPPAAPGGGNYWSYDQTTHQVVHRWQPIDPGRETPS